MRILVIIILIRTPLLLILHVLKRIRLRLLLLESLNILFITQLPRILALLLVPRLRLQLRRLLILVLTLLLLFQLIPILLRLL